MAKKSMLHLVLAGLLMNLLSGCASAPAAVTSSLAFGSPAANQRVPVQVAGIPFALPTDCTGTFVAHELDHTTNAGGTTPRLFDSNGSGLAINDLDGDGNQDIVLANLSGPATILWNRGGLQFERQPLPMVHRTRGVAIVDVDGDARQDIVFTSGIAAPAFFRNGGERTFQLTPLPGITRPAYAMNWNDLDGDGDLDLVTGSYDAGQMVEAGTNYLFADPAGVNVYLQDRGAWQGQRLAEAAQALAIALWDLNDDGGPDIWVGNDFDAYDEVWLQTPVTGTAAIAWQEATPFEHTSHSTMGIDRGDVDGNGTSEYYATDMKPFQLDPLVLAEWMPLMDAATKQRKRNDPQISENVLQVRTADGYRNEGYDRKLDAAGWSWSGKFGDLDSDGDLDLYVVNGMIAADLLDHLPHGELVEANQALRNDGSGYYLEAPEWDLASTRSGRGMSMADLDRDGDLDIVVNNLREPAQLFENRTCAAGDRLLLDLRWEGTANPFAVGAVAVLHTDQGDLLRDVRAVSGYLSGDPAQLHFALPPGARPSRLSVRWPDGANSQVNDIPVNQHLTVTR